MEDLKNPTNMEWKHPDQVMHLHRLKVKKRALQARMNRENIHVLEKNTPQSTFNQQTQSVKRKNPFLRTEVEKKSKNESIQLETSTDNTLFELFNIQRPQSSPKVSNESITESSLSFTNILSHLEINKTQQEPEPTQGETYVPIDWTLLTKMRIMSPKPFPWNSQLKTSEQASGTTGFVRCLDIGEKDTTLDTSPNARFHRCCLVWQHPSLPWLGLFPRVTGKVSANVSNHANIGSNQSIKDSLYEEWSESFRSLFHLLRARQCPFFYLCANNFTVLYRAAGICGVSEVHAFLTPTTRGFRQCLKQEDIEYTMPLRKESKRRSDTVDSGLETLDSCSSHAKDSAYDDDVEDHESQTEWLESLGIEDSEFIKISSQGRSNLDINIDNQQQSLIFVKGVEAQALFNFLLNCKSAIATTGALAGIPPTLLAPTAFHGATLKALKVKESVVRVEKEKFHSLELKGPILPHVLTTLCNLMKSSQLERYSISCAQISQTSSFTIAKDNLETTEAKDNVKVPHNIFDQENLSDCGFNQDLLNHFCNNDPARIQIVDTLKFSNGLYSWSSS